MLTLERYQNIIVKTDVLLLAWCITIQIKKWHIVVENDEYKNTYMYYRKGIKKGEDR